MSRKLISKDRISIDKRDYAVMSIALGQLVEFIAISFDVAPSKVTSDVTVRARKIMRDHPELIDHLVNEHLKHERNPDVDGIISRFNKPA